MVADLGGDGCSGIRQTAKPGGEGRVEGSSGGELHEVDSFGVEAADAESGGGRELWRHSAAGEERRQLADRPQLVEDAESDGIAGDRIGTQQEDACGGHVLLGGLRTAVEDRS